MAEKVKQYTRTSANGQTVTVKAYDRSNADVAEAVVAIPGRPLMAAKMGTFAGGRAIPGIWAKPVVPKPPTEAPPSNDAQATAKSLGDTLDGVPGAEAAMKALRALHQTPVAEKPIPLPKKKTSKTLPVRTSDSTKAQKVIKAAADILLDPNTVSLAGPIRVRSYKRRDTKTGKIVDVEAYTQLRDLVSHLGGPQMAAKKGITPEVFKTALPNMPDDTFATVQTPASAKISAIRKATSAEAGDKEIPAKKAAAKKAPVKKVPENSVEDLRQGGLTYKEYEDEQRALTPTDPRWALGHFEHKKFVAGLKKSHATLQKKHHADPDRPKVMLYRGEGSLDKDSLYKGNSTDAGGWWTTNPESARDYAAKARGVVYQIEVDKTEAEPRGGATNHFISDPKVRARRTPYASHEPPLETAKSSLLDDHTSTTAPAAMIPPPPVHNQPVAPPKIGARYLVDAMGFLSFRGQSYKMAKGDTAYQLRGHDSQQGYLTTDAQGNRKSLILTGHGQTEKVVGDDIDYQLGQFLVDAQDQYSRDNDLPDSGLSDRLYRDDGSLDEGLLRDLLTPVWVQKNGDEESRQHIDAVEDALTALPQGTSVQDGKGDVYDYDGQQWSLRGKPVPLRMVSVRVGNASFGDPKTDVANAVQQPDAESGPRTYDHNLARKANAYDRGFPPMNGPKNLHQKAQAAVLEAVKFAPPTVAARFPQTYVGHERTQEIDNDPSSTAFVALYAGASGPQRQEMHLSDKMSSPEYESTHAAMKASGWQVPSDVSGFQSVVNHESGHVFENMLTISGSQETGDRYYSGLLQVLREEFGYQANPDDDPKAAYTKAAAALKPELRASLSTYGASDEREVIAEAWAEFIGALQPRRLARKFGLVMQQMMDDLEADLSASQKRMFESLRSPSITGGS